MQNIKPYIIPHLGGLMYGFDEQGTQATAVLCGSAIARLYHYSDCDVKCYTVGIVRIM